MIDINTACDECFKALSDGDEVYCARCWKDKDNEIASLKDRIAELEAEAGQ